MPNIATVGQGSDSSHVERELRPAGRYEWEQIIRRARLRGLIGASERIGKDGRPTKGAMSGLAVTGIALGLATWASGDGGDVYPGDAVVAVALETTLQAVRRVRLALLRVGLIEPVRRRRGRHGDEYRLTLPSDLLDQVEVWTPARCELAAARLRDAARGKRSGGSGGSPEDTGRVGPADPPDVPSGGSAGQPQGVDDESGEGSGGSPETGSGGPSGTAWGGPADSRTYQDLATTTTDHSDEDLRTEVAVPCARAPDEDQDSLDVGDDWPAVDAAPADPGIVEKCPKHPAFRAGLRPNGLPWCPPCKAQANVGHADPTPARPVYVRAGMDECLDCINHRCERAEHRRSFTAGELAGLGVPVARSRGTRRRPAGPPPAGESPGVVVPFRPRTA